MADNTNILANHSGNDPLVNFNFMLRVELAIDVPCKSVHAFQRELEFDQIQEGGLNDYVHMRRKPISKPFTLEIERYVGTDYYDPLPLGAELVLPLLLFVSRTPGQFVPGVTARTYVFHGCTVMSKRYGDLAADQAGILVETITIAYREMLCVDVPWNKTRETVSAPDPVRAQSAKTLSTEPEDLQEQGRQLYADTRKAVAVADTQFEESSVSGLVTELGALKRELESGAAPGGLLARRETNAQNTLNGMNQASMRPLFDLVNDLKAAVAQKKNALREAERSLRSLQAAENVQPESVSLQVEGVEAAQLELDAAQKALDAVQNEATMAQKELALAIDDLKKAKESIHSLENTVNNLNLRTVSVKEARGKYTESLSLCSSANSTLQQYSGANGEHHSDIRRAYQEVKKHHDDTTVQTKRVDEADSYRKNGEKLYEQLSQWWISVQTRGMM